MGFNVQNNSGLLHTEFVRIIRDFAHYLSLQKQSGNPGFDISEKSEQLINSWGSKSRTSSLPSSERPGTADVFIIDSETTFFNGESGELLKKIITAMNLSLDSVFICSADDLKSIDAKISAVSPKVIITLGEKAGQSLLGVQYPLEQYRGKFHDYKGVKVMPTFHPSLLLKQSQLKRQVWEDMKQVMNLPGLTHGS